MAIDQDKLTDFLHKFVGDGQSRGDLAAGPRWRLGDQVTFDVASAQTFTDGPYNLVTSFDCLHDMGDPVGAASHIRQMLAPDSTWMVVEPYRTRCHGTAVTPSALRRARSRYGGSPPTPGTQGSAG